MKYKSILRRMSLLFLLLACAFSATFAQATYLCNEKFSSKKPSGWDILPAYSATAPSWKPDTGICVSAKYAMHGLVPYSTGDTATLVTPFFDCTNYQYVMIRFNHICKVLPSDICRIEYQEDVLGTANKWRAIPYDAYKGGCATYRQDSGFSHTSYSTWADYDTLAKPTNGWWKQETFNMSDYAGYSKVRFRFIIRKGSYLGSFIAAGWYVDDFQVLASKYELKPPVVQFLSDLSDTVYSAGPFVVQAKVATRTLAKIVNPYLAYSITYEGKTKKDSIRMTAVKGDSIWEATIPQQYYGTEVSYSIFGRDANGNNSRAAGSFVNKRMKAGKVSGYTYYMPGDTTGASTNNLAIVYHVGYATSLSRSLYLASEINPKNKPMVFSKLAWYNRSYTTVVTRNIKIWMLATNDQTTVTGFMDPTTSGATLVYNGATTSQLKWNEVTLQKPFALPAGKNLYIFYEGVGGTTSSSYIYWAGHSQSSRCTYNYSGSWTGSTMVPLIRLGLGGGANYDSNSVALASIDSPTESTVAGKQQVKVTIQNMGDGYLDYCNVNWMVNGVLQTPKTWKGHLYTDFYDTLTLGSYTQKLMGYDTVTVWVGNPNNKVDSVLDDDTLTVIAFGCDSLLKGEYTVGKGGKYTFASLTDAFKLLETCGWGGDVTLKLASGTYTDNMDFNGYKAPAGHRLTITSIAGVADSVVIKPASNPVVNLNNCSGLVFSRIKFDATNVSTYCVQLGSGLDNIEFNHCILQGYKSTTTGNAHSVIYKPSGSAISDIRFIGNRILDGSYSIYMYGSSSSSKNRAILFDSNYISGFYYYAGYFYYNKMQFTHNVIEETEDIYNYNYGIYCYYLDSTLFDANRIITHSHSNYQYSLRTYYTDSATVISNNEIILNNSNSGTSYGLYIYYPSGTKVINNSVLTYGTATAYGLYTYMYSTAYRAEIKNNIVACVGTGTNYPLYTSSITAAASYDLDYNCFWSKGMMTYESTSITSEAAHQKNFPNAIHDYYSRPVFKDSTKSLTLKVTSGMECPKIAGVDYDINGNLRLALTTRGAHSIKPVPVNGILANMLDVPEKTDAGDTLRPRVILTNGGMDTITEANIRVELNGVAVGRDLQWKGRLGLGQSDTINMGTFILKGGDNVFKAYIVKLGTLKDTINDDDTVSVSTYTCAQRFAGTYNVGKGGLYTSVGEFLDRLMLCGMSGPVTVNMLPGTYRENVILTAIPGSSKTNTLTFTSSTGDSSDVEWEREDDAYATQTSTLAAPLVLDGASHIVIKNITLSGMAPNTTGGYYYSHGISITGSSQDIEVHNCHLYVPKSFTNAVSGTSHCAVSIYQGTVRDVRIHHNLIEGGGTGCYVYGTSASRVSNVTIEHNEIGYVDYSAIYAYYTDSVTFSFNHAKHP
ncbi:MAG: right-handed parallel beta-helix repeat-containing protein [Bacteroidales bacterium]|nr:right-handed parallel beta-helix repeat-containing protein [Bacteroidales bacterium]